MKKGSKHTKTTKRKIALSRKKYTGSNHPHWKGGNIIVDGYVYIYSPNHPHKTKDKYVCEHRLVVEEHLGRFLKPHETVHHKNGNKKDNRLSNLELFESVGQHTAKHHIKRNSKTGRFV